MQSLKRMLPPAFYQPPDGDRVSVLIRQVQRHRLESLESGFGQFYSDVGRTITRAYVSIKCEGCAWATARFMSLAEAERAANYLSNLAEGRNVGS